MKLHYKLFITFGSIMAIALLFVFIYLDNNINAYYVSQLRDNIKRQTVSIKDTMYRLDNSGSDIDDFVHQIGKDLSIRITVIDQKGRVIGDSDVDRNEIYKMENHLERPEIQEAIKKGEGWSQRFSTTLKKDIIYYATSLHDSGLDGFIRLSIPVERISIISHDIEGTLLVSISVVFVATLLVALIVFNLISRPIRDLAAKALDMSSGDFSCNLDVSSKDEVGDLAKSLNAMRENIKERIKEIVSNNSKFETVLMSMFDGVMVLDKNGAIQLMNTALSNILDIKDDFKGKKPIEVIRNANIQSIAEDAVKLYSGVVTREENLLFPYNKTLLIHATPVVKDGDIFGAVLVFSDITELRKLETIRKDFVANVSHELRTPISSIKGYAETLLDGALEDKKNAAAFIKIINQEAGRLASLINDILDLSKIESDIFKIKLGEYKINDVVGNAIQIVSKDINSKSIKVVNDVEAVSIKMDQDLIVQAMINLINNAVKYSPEHSSIRVSSEVSGAFLRVSVEDSGIGIPEKDLSRIFERFYRVDKARSKDLGGTGLGLSIVKHIVQSHGGDVSVKSTEGVGSVFSFTIPLS